MISRKLARHLHALRRSSDRAIDALSDTPGTLASASAIQADLDLVRLVDECRKAIDERIERWSTAG